LITLIIGEAKFTENKVYETILYSGLVLIATIVFIILAYFYKYVEDEPKVEISIQSSNSQV